MLIFDATSFSNDKVGIGLYGPKGYRPILPGKINYQPMHLLTLISSRAIEAVSLVKGSLNSEIMCHFFDMALKGLELRRGIGNLPLFLFLDNAPVHGVAMAKKVFEAYRVKLVYNPPANPAKNPIEVLFSVIKRI